MNRRAAPARQIMGLHTFSQFLRFFDGGAKVVHNTLALHPPAKKVGPQKLAERRRILGEAADPAKLSGEAAERIVFELFDRFGNFREVAAAPVFVVRVHPTVMIEHQPEVIGVSWLRSLTTVTNTFFTPSSCSDNARW